MRSPCSPTLGWTSHIRGQFWPEISSSLTFNALFKLPERPYDVGQEDNVEENNEEDGDSEEPGMALEIYLDILG